MDIVVKYHISNFSDVEYKQSKQNQWKIPNFKRVLRFPEPFCLALSLPSAFLLLIPTPSTILLASEVKRRKWLWRLGWRWEDPASLNSWCCRCNGTWNFHGVAVESPHMLSVCTSPEMLLLMADLLPKTPFLQRWRTSVLVLKFGVLMLVVGIWC